MKTAIVSQKGWVVIPREIRDRYGMQPGTKVAIVEYGGVVSLVPLPEDPLAAMRGFLKGDRSLTQELLAERRRERAHEQEKIERRGGASR